MKVLVLSGGCGSRLWPLSREDFPKQFVKTEKNSSLLQQTFQRAVIFNDLTEIITLTHKNYFFFVEYKNLNYLGNHTYILEPFGRNTAPPIALAAWYTLSQGSDEPLLVLPSDHVIEDNEAFRLKVESVLPWVEQGEIAAFGIFPDAPKTAYGYIEVGRLLALSVNEVKRFVEKPSLIQAQALLDQGSYYWNAGIFLFKPSVMLAAFAQYAPLLWQATQSVWEHMQRDKVLGENVYVIPEKFFEQVAEILKHDNHVSYKSSQRTRRPWGEYVVLEEYANFKIKRLIINPKSALSLQYHQHRSEYWVVVMGQAKVTRGKKEFILKIYESVLIGQGVIHRLENLSDSELLIVIEVQAGDYLGEDDIMRLQDSYGRVSEEREE